MIKQRGHGLGTVEGNLRMGYYQQQSPSRVSAGADLQQQLPPAYFCTSDQTSASTCRTFSPSPQVSETPSGRHSNRSLPSPDDDCGAVDQGGEDEEEERRRRYSEVAISSDGESSIRSGRGRLPSTPNETGKAQQRARRVLWNEFDGPAAEGLANDGRALARRHHAFKIFVVFRGGWCTSSHALLQGFAELNPEIKRAGGKVVALSSQTPKQVNRTAAELKLPFQAFGDPSNELVTEMNRRFNMGCTITRNDITTEAYPDGMAQPCVLAVRTDDAQNEDSVLYKWCQWQTIASMKHDDAWAQITRSLSYKSGEAPVPESGGNGSGPPTPTSRYTTHPPTRRRPRPSTPHRSMARGSSPSSYASTGGGGGGYAPFAGQQVDAAAPGSGGSAPSIATARATPGEERVETPPQGVHAQTIGEAVDRALAVGWMKMGRNSGLVTPRGTADSNGGGGDLSVDGIAGGRSRGQRGRRVTTPWGGGSKTTAGAPRAGKNHRDACFFPEVPEDREAAPADGARESVDGSGGSSHRRAETGRRGEGRAAAGGTPPGGGAPGGASTASRKTRRLRGERDSQGSRVGGSDSSKPPTIPSSRPPTYTQATAAGGGASGVLPPQHRYRNHSDASDKRSTSLRPEQGQQQQQQQEEKRSMTPSGRSTRRFWFGSGSRRSSFEQAAADFNRGGGGGGSGGDGAGSTKDQRNAGGGRGFMTWPAGSGGGGEGGGDAGGETVGELKAPPTPRRWGYRRKGARPPTTPKTGGGAATIAASASASPRFPNPHSGVR